MTSIIKALLNDCENMYFRHQLNIACYVNLFKVVLNTAILLTVAEANIYVSKSTNNFGNSESLDLANTHTLLPDVKRGFLGVNLEEKT